MTVTVSHPADRVVAGGRIVHTEAVEPGADEIRQQLDRLVASEGFANADRMSSFLRFVVERALAGEADSVKEYVIGVEVFGRDQAYDPRLDSIVRVEARRLRAKLDEYYATAGAMDPIVIRIRRGSYVPAFERRQDAVSGASIPPETAAAASPSDPVPAERRPLIVWRLGLAAVVAALVLVTLAARTRSWTTTPLAPPGVSVAVLPFTHYSTDASDALLAARLTDGVTRELARLGSVGVVSHTSARQFADGRRAPAPEIGRALNAQVLMEGSVTRSGDRLDVDIRLVNAVADRKMWVKDFTGSARDPRELERRIAAAAAPAALAPR